MTSKFPLNWKATETQASCPQSLSSSFTPPQSAPPLSRCGREVEEEVRVLAVGAAFWLSREKTCWVLLQYKQMPPYTIQDDLACPCAEDKTKRNNTKILAI